MKTISWNCRGIENDLTVRRFTEMCQKHHPRLVFLSETKNRRLLQNIQADLGFYHLYTVEPLGLSGVIDGIKVYMMFVYGDHVLERRDQHNVNSAKLVEELKEKVEGLYADDNATTEEIAATLKELSDDLKAEKMFWKQKSRVFWLREGDRNTKKIHAFTKQRRERNKITQLWDANGNIVEDEEGLVVIATSYFRQIFESSNPEDIEEA
ncbi:hypothetical protein Bca4012_044284 [Brassica carinata]